MSNAHTVHVDQVEWDHEVDVLVAGSGNGGFSAAIAAAEAGARTLLIEVSGRTGGGTAISGGVIGPHFAASYEDLVERTHGMHEESFSRAYWEGWEQYREWLLSIGANCQPTEIGAYVPIEGSISMGSDPSKPSQPQARDYFTSLEKVFAGLGGELLLKTRALHLLTDVEGKIVGLRARQWVDSPKESHGRLVSIRAENVILSVGGFQNSKEYNTRFVAPDADLIAPVGSPYNCGDGIAIAQEVGAALSGSLSNVYGSMMSAFPARRPMEDPETWEAATEEERSRFFELLFFMTPPGWVGVNLEGRRFVDEDAEYYRIAQEVTKQTRATGVMIFDHAMYAAVADLRISEPGTGASESEKFRNRSRLEGVELIEADTLDELVDKIVEPGPSAVYRANLVRTLEEVNDAADTGADLPVPRSQRVKLEHGPFYAWPFTSGIVYTMGGLAINTDAQVLDRHRVPIDGLYASPPCAGGVFRNHYGGSIASAGVFGWIAGRHAAARVAARRPSHQRSAG